jgi:hypothetical protein
MRRTARQALVHRGTWLTKTSLYDYPPITHQGTNQEAQRGLVMINDRSYRDCPGGTDVCGAARRTRRSARWTTTGSAGWAFGPAAPRRVDTSLTRVRASGARNECQCVGVPSPPLFLPNSDGTEGALHHYTLSEGCPVSCGTEKSSAFVLDKVRNVSMPSPL